MLIELCGSVASSDQNRSTSNFDNLTRVQDLVLSVIEKYEGTVVKKLAGSLLVVFESPTVAVKAGMELQRRNRGEYEVVFSEARIEVKVAINTGEIAVSHDDAYGEAVTLLQELRKIIDPGQVIFTEATYLAMNKLHIPEAEMGYYKIGGNVDRIKVYKIREEEINVARISSRSLSYFGLLRHDQKNRPYKVFPAPTGRRVIAGVLEFWIGFLLMVGFSIVCRLPQIWALMFDVIRIQAEDFKADGNLRLQQSHDKRFMGVGVVLTGKESLKAEFAGPSGDYYIVSAYAFKGSDGAGSDAVLVVGKREIPYHNSFRSRDHSQIEELDGPIRIEKGENIRIDSYPRERQDGADTETKEHLVSIDYVEFIPQGSFAYRPKGWEIGYRYIDFYRAINYDDMNLHFFLGPLPLWIFLHLFIVQALFSRTLGGMIMGLHIQTEKTNERIGLWTALLRTICWFLVPFWGWTAIGKDHQWTDSVSNSRVVVFRD